MKDRLQDRNHDLKIKSLKNTTHKETMIVNVKDEK